MRKIPLIGMRGNIFCYSVSSFGVDKAVCFQLSALCNAVIILDLMASRKTQPVVIFSVFCLFIVRNPASARKEFFHVCTSVVMTDHEEICHKC